MEFADINAFGGQYGYTPNLDGLASMGMAMTDVLLGQRGLLAD